VYRLNDEQAIIQTVDFFPPVVDDPYDYGAVAAANSMSDVFAMGGEVLFALNIAAWPESLSLEILSQIFEGGADKLAEAGGVIAGGHTVTDEEPKYGLVVTGMIHPERVLTKAGAKPDDRVFLTKPIGTGVITTANKQSACESSHLQAAIDSMLKLNLAASRLIQSTGVNACTDITGYGVIGHGMEVANKSGVQLALDASTIPVLDGAERYASEGRLPGGANRNQAFYSSSEAGQLHIDHEVPQVIRNLLFDPETSGGLLVTVSDARAEALRTAFQAAGEPLWEIGRVASGSGVMIRAR
jgi:selenide, water dikinase